MDFDALERYHSLGLDAVRSVRAAQEEVSRLQRAQGEINKETQTVKREHQTLVLAIEKSKGTLEELDREVAQKKVTDQRLDNSIAQKKEELSRIEEAISTARKSLGVTA